MEKMELKVSGMHCDGCASRIEKALSSMDGVEEVHASFKSGKVEMVADPKQLNAIKEKLSDIGFAAVGE